MKLTSVPGIQTATGVCISVTENTPNPLINNVLPRLQDPNHQGGLLYPGVTASGELVTSLLAPNPEAAQSHRSQSATVGEHAVPAMELAQLYHAEPYVRRAPNEHDANIEIESYIRETATLRHRARIHGIDTLALETVILDALKTRFAETHIRSSEYYSLHDAFESLYYSCETLLLCLTPCFPDKNTWAQDHIAALLSEQIRRYEHTQDPTDETSPQLAWSWIHSIRRAVTYQNACNYQNEANSRGILISTFESVFLASVTSSLAQRPGQELIHKSFCCLGYNQEMCHPVLKILLDNISQKTQAWIDEGASLRDIIHTMSQLQCIVIYEDLLNAIERLPECKKTLIILQTAIITIMQREQVNNHSLIDTWVKAYSESLELGPIDEYQLKNNFLTSSSQMLLALMQSSKREQHETCDKNSMNEIVQNLDTAERVKSMYTPPSTVNSDLPKIINVLLHDIPTLAQMASSQRQPWTTFDEADHFLAQTQIVNKSSQAIKHEAAFASIVPVLLSNFAQRVLAIETDHDATSCTYLQYALQIIDLFPGDLNKARSTFEPLLKHASIALHNMTTPEELATIIDGIPKVLHITMKICDALPGPEHTEWRKSCWQAAIEHAMPNITRSLITSITATRGALSSIAIFESTFPLQKKLASAWPGEHHRDARNMFLGCILDAIQQAQPCIIEKGPFGKCDVCSESMDANSGHEAMRYFITESPTGSVCCASCVWDYLQKNGCNVVGMVEMQTGQELSLETCATRGMSAARLMQFAAFRGRFLLDKMYHERPFEHCLDLGCIGGAEITHAETSRSGVTDAHRRLLLQQARQETRCCLCCMPMSPSNTQEGRRAEFELIVRKLVAGLLGGSPNGEHITRECPSCAHADEKDAKCATVVGGCPCCKAAWNWNSGPGSGMHATFFASGQPIQAYTLSSDAMKKSPLGIIGLLTLPGLSGQPAQQHIIEALGISDGAVTHGGWHVVPDGHITDVMQKAEQRVKILLEAHWAKEDQASKTLLGDSKT